MDAYFDPLYPHHLHDHWSDGLYHMLCIFEI